MVKDITQHLLVAGHSTDSVEYVQVEHTITNPFNITAVKHVQKDHVLWKEAPSVRLVMSVTVVFSNMQKNFYFS